MIDRNFLKLLNIYKKATGDIILDGGRLNTLLPGSGPRQGGTLSTSLVNITLTFLTVQQERKRGNVIQIRTEARKLSLFTDDITTT